ncbi:MAG TPA: glycosyltransferase family 1 protein [Acidobacteriota bacterium]|nr:glycosyltransferase family 1 protein [Acidobacteriota bacterium]
MRIGIFPVLNRSGGGHYQYSLTFLQALSHSSKLHNDEFVIFADDIEQPELLPSGSQWSIRPARPFSLKRAAKGVLRKIVGEEGLFGIWEKYRTQLSVPDPDAKSTQPRMRDWLINMGIELILYPSANPLSFEAGIPYVIAIHDLQHLLQPEFPENSQNDEVQWREYVFRNGVRYATFILADSEVGKEDILHFYGSYGVTPDRVKVLPFLPASYLPTQISQHEIERVRKRYSLPDRYLFYPAQFWPHKNHLRIFKALAMLKHESGLSIPIVLSGSFAGQIRKKTYEELNQFAQENGINDQILYPGYLPETDMAPFYAGAAALVMPTFHGPTNIPVLEAWAYGCPVITSDLRGIREQAGDAAILVDPRSERQIADAISKIWTDENCRLELAHKGRSRLASYTPEDFETQLTNVILEAKELIGDTRQQNLAGRR